MSGSPRLTISYTNQSTRATSQAAKRKQIPQVTQWHNLLGLLPEVTACVVPQQKLRRPPGSQLSSTKSRT